MVNASPDVRQPRPEQVAGRGPFVSTHSQPARRGRMVGRCRRSHGGQAGDRTVTTDWHRRRSPAANDGYARWRWSRFSAAPQPGDILHYDTMVTRSPTSTTRPSSRSERRLPGAWPARGRRASSPDALRRMQRQRHRDTAPRWRCVRSSSTRTPLPRRLSAARPPTPSRHRVSPRPRRGLRRRLFLARLPGARHVAQGERGMVAGEDRGQPPEGRRART